MAAILRPEATPEDFSRRAEGFLPGWFGMKVTAITPGRLEMELPIKQEMLAPNGFLHAASIVALADTAAGFATIAHLPEGSESFTTIELKANYFKPVWKGLLRATGKVVKRSRTLGYIECEVVDAGGSLVCKLASTCMVLREQAAAGR